MAETTVDFISPVQITVDSSQVSVGPGGETIIDLTAGADGALLAANNLDDLDDAATALTNLGGTTVGKAVFVASAASDARSAIGSRPAGDALFTANTAADARATLGITNLISQTVYLPDIIAANADVIRVVAPVTGTVVSADLVLNAATATGACTATLLVVGSGAMTGGVCSVTGAAATVGAANPSANNAVTERTSVVSITIGGANTQAGDGTILIRYQPA